MEVRQNNRSCYVPLTAFTFSANTVCLNYTGGNEVENLDRVCVCVWEVGWIHIGMVGGFPAREGIN